ncbi:MAG: choice-of-anchor tandem repeat GloVer-containing protein [Verrucomicrobiota bacterium]
MASFSGLNGALPYSGLLLTSDGSLFGTTSQGGTNGLPFGYGTIFRLNSSGVLTTLFSFNSTNGAKPYGALALGGDGNLYGTTWVGGISNVGTAFRMTTNGLHTTLLSFSNINGAKPSGRLIKGQDGHFYGTTQFGGTTNQGTVFRLTTNGVLTTLASFSDTNGANPYAEVVQGSDGHLYGTTVNGGPSDVGAVFRVTTNGVLTPLYIFSGPDGANPYGGLVQDPDGILYGTTAYGGANGYGTIFKITTNGSLTTLYSFTGVLTGQIPGPVCCAGVTDSFTGQRYSGGARTAYQGAPSSRLQPMDSWHRWLLSSSISTASRHTHPLFKMPPAIFTAQLGKVGPG